MTRLNLSIDSLARACKGNAALLPRIVVHENHAWPWEKVRIEKRPDGTSRLHMRRAMFLRSVLPHVPVRPGLHIRMDAQEYIIDLKPHHLQGSGDRQEPGRNRSVATLIAQADEAGRLPDEEDHGAPVVERSERRQVDRDDLERVARDPEKRGVCSAVLSGDGDPD